MFHQDSNWGRLQVRGIIIQSAFGVQGYKRPVCLWRVWEKVNGRKKERVIFHHLFEVFEWFAFGEVTHYRAELWLNFKNTLGRQFQTHTVISASFIRISFLLTSPSAYLLGFATVPTMRFLPLACLYVAVAEAEVRKYQFRLHNDTRSPGPEEPM